jgi:hypothetical protein
LDDLTIAVTIVPLSSGPEFSMATSMHGLESHANHAVPALRSLPISVPLDLEDDRILIDIETEMAARLHMESKIEKPMQRIPHFLLEGRTLGPLSVLLILALYSLLSPLLSPEVHEYIYRILH